jgi:hypothetical protein
MSLAENVGGLLSFEAASDLSTKLYYAVVINSSGQLAVAGAGQAAIGILYSDPDATGLVASVKPLDGRKAKAIAGGTIAAGAFLAADSAGKLVTATKGIVDTSDTTGSATDPLIGSHVLGIATQAAVAGDIFEFLAIPLGLVPTTAA